MGQIETARRLREARSAARVAGADTAASVKSYLSRQERNPLLLQGDALKVLSSFPDQSIDFCMTSPPYWGQRQYSTEGIGLESTFGDYIDHLCDVIAGVRRVLKPTGSFWLNIGDAYSKKCLVGLPWRVALRLVDEQGWILRNKVVWHKVKGGLDNSRDKLRNVHEDVFHFVKSKKYFYDVDAVRSSPKSAKIVNGAVVSATGVSGVRYRRQLELSAELSDEEKATAFKALDDILAEVRAGNLADFRMIIRGQQRTTHSDAEKVSGRAREIRDRGFYFLKYHPNGSKPSDVWDIIPEDSQRRAAHFAPYPEDLCRIPMLATCPENGVALDPFCGTGTTMYVAYRLGRKSIGIDLAGDYLELAQERCRGLL